METTLIVPPPVPTGAFKTFGPFGTTYQVGKVLNQLSDGDWMVQITMIDTGEQAEYRLTHLNDDPGAH